MSTIEECVNDETNYCKDEVGVTLYLNHVLIDENHPFDFAKIPNDVTELELPGDWMKHYCNSDYLATLPLKEIDFGNFFDEELWPGFLPHGLEEIIFGQSYNKPIKYRVIPNSCKTITIGKKWKMGYEGWFDQPKELVILPSSVKKVTIHYGVCPLDHEHLRVVTGCSKTYEKGTQEFSDRFSVTEPMVKNAYT